MVTGARSNGVGKPIRSLGGLGCSPVLVTYGTKPIISVDWISEGLKPGAIASPNKLAQSHGGRLTMSASLSKIVPGVKTERRRRAREKVGGRLVLVSVLGTIFVKSADNLDPLGLRFNRGACIVPIDREPGKKYQSPSNCLAITKSIRAVIAFSTRCTS